MYGNFNTHTRAHLCSLYVLHRVGSCMSLQMYVTVILVCLPHGQCPFIVINAICLSTFRRRPSFPIDRRSGNSCSLRSSSSPSLEGESPHGMRSTQPGCPPQETVIEISSTDSSRRLPSLFARTTSARSRESVCGNDGRDKKERNMWIPSICVV